MDATIDRMQEHYQAMRSEIAKVIVGQEEAITAVSKAIRRNLEKMITMGKTKDLVRYRKAISFLRDEDAAAACSALHIALSRPEQFPLSSTPTHWPFS